MKISQHNFQSSLAPDITRFLAQKRALGKKFGTEQKHFGCWIATWSNSV